MLFFRLREKLKFGGHAIQDATGTSYISAKVCQVTKEVPLVTVDCHLPDIQ